MSLDQYEETFAQALAMGFTPVSANDEGNLGLSPVEASMLSQRSDIRERVNQIVRNDEIDLGVEHLRIARQLEMDRDFAYSVGNPGAAINATVQRGKLLGVFIERTSSETFVAVSNAAELSPEEWAAKFGNQKQPERE